MVKENSSNIDKKKCPNCGKMIAVIGFKNHLNQHKQGLIKPKSKASNNTNVSDVAKKIDSKENKSNPAKIYIIDRNKKSTSITTPEKVIKERKKKVDANKYLNIALLSVKEQPKSIPLLEREKVKKIEFKIDNIDFYDGTFKTLNYQYEKKTDWDFRSTFNDVKDIYKTKYGSTIVLEVVENKGIRENENLYSMRRRFIEIYREKFEAKCDICNLYFPKDKIDEHKRGCEEIVMPTKVDENIPEKMIIRKTDGYLSKGQKQSIDGKNQNVEKKTKREGIYDICLSIQNQNNYDKNCKYRSVGRLQSKSVRKGNKVFWLYNDMPENTIVKNDMLGQPISVIRDPNISKVINGTPISKNHKVVYDLLSSTRAKNNTGKVDLMILNKASYFNASDGKTKGVKIQSRITKDAVSWASLESLVKKIEEINALGIKLNETQINAKLLDIIQGASTEELFADIKPFIRRAMELRGLGYLESDQEDIKRSHIFDGCTLVIDGGPGTGKTTSLVQRIRFLTSPSALLSYQVFNDENDPIYQSLINTKNQNWIFYSPTQLLAEYLKSNMASEGLETGPNYVKVWNEDLSLIAKDYFDILIFKEANYYKQESFNDITAAFKKYVFQYYKKQYFKDNSSQVFETPEIKTIFQRIENYKAKLNIDENLLNLERSYNLISQNYKDEIEKIIAKGKKIYKDLINSILANISDEDKKILEIEIEKYSKDDDSRKASLEKVIDGLFRKKISILSGKKVKFNELQKAFDGALNIDIDKSNAVYISESVQFEELYLDYFKNFDSQYLQSIFKIYQRFRESEEVIGLQANNDIKQWGKDELAFLIGEINEYIITKSLTATNIKYVNIYKQYAKNIIAVDEASDLNLYDLKCIYSFRHWGKNSVTFCGDILQRMTNDGIKDWDDLETIIKNMEVLKLKISYRQSPTLLELAKKIYKKVTNKDADYKPYLSKHKSEPKPLLYINKDENGRFKWVIERLNDICRAYGNNMPSTAIFVNSADEIGKVAKNINKININSNLTIEAYDKSLDLNKKENTIIIFPIDEIKGLEFEAVIFVDLNKILQTNLDEDLLLRYIYIGLSRSAYYFGITGSEKFTGALEFLNSAFNEKGTWT